MYKKVLVIAGLVGVGVAGRLLPHVPNATPITAITLAAHKNLGRVWALIIPMAAMVLSDAYIGFYNWKILASVYASFTLIGCMSWVVKKNSNSRVALAVAVAASVAFFLITNFAVWTFSPWYEKSITGLFYCYTLGLPFLRNMLLGDIVYTVVLFPIATYARRVSVLKMYCGRSGQGRMIARLEAWRSV